MDKIDQVSFMKLQSWQKHVMRVSLSIITKGQTAGVLTGLHHIIVGPPQSHTVCLVVSVKATSL